MEDFYNTYSFLLNRTARKARQYAQRRFMEFGFAVTVDQWTLLKALDEKGPLWQHDLAKQTFKDQPTLTRMIDLLCEKELVSRTVDEADRRRLLVALTEKGQLLVNDMRPKVAEIRKKAWENLSQQDFEHFKHVLDTIYNNLDC
jgi:DNA-binding MarR family transcriptional regulator